jgi:hypothetical protein
MKKFYVFNNFRPIDELRLKDYKEKIFINIFNSYIDKFKSYIGKYNSYIGALDNYIDDLLDFISKDSLVLMMDNSGDSGDENEDSSNRRLDKGKGKEVIDESEEEANPYLDEEEVQKLRELEQKHNNVGTTGDIYRDADNRSEKIKGDLEQEILNITEQDHTTPEMEQELDSLCRIFEYVSKQQEDRKLEAESAQLDEDYDMEEGFDEDEDMDMGDGLSEEERKEREDLDMLDDELETK